MDSGQDKNAQPSAIERAVLASERRVFAPRPWFHHRAFWGAAGLCLGLIGGAGLSRMLSVDTPVAYTQPTSTIANSAPQQFSSSRPEQPTLAKVEEKKPPEVTAEQASEALHRQMPTIPADLPRMPMVMPSELRGNFSAGPVRPEINVEPIEDTPEKPASAPVESEKVRRSKEILARIAALQAQRDELLKSFYEDAVPVKHVDQDIAKAEAELRELSAKK